MWLISSAGSNTVDEHDHASVYVLQARKTPTNYHSAIEERKVARAFNETGRYSIGDPKYPDNCKEKLNTASCHTGIIVMCVANFKFKLNKNLAEEMRWTTDVDEFS